MIIWLWLLSNSINLGTEKTKDSHCVTGSTSQCLIARHKFAVDAIMSVITAHLCQVSDDAWTRYPTDSIVIPVITGRWSTALTVDGGLKVVCRRANARLIGGIHASHFPMGRWRTRSPTRITRIRRQAFGEVRIFWRARRVPLSRALIEGKENETENETRKLNFL